MRIVYHIGAFNATSLLLVATRVTQRLLSNVVGT
jgi:hypothetical protein